MHAAVEWLDVEELPNRVQVAVEQLLADKLQTVLVLERGCGRVGVPSPPSLSRSNHLWISMGTASLGEPRK